MREAKKQIKEKAHSNWCGCQTSLEKTKKRIEDIFKTINLLEDQIEEIIDKHIGLGIPMPGMLGLYDDAQWFLYQQSGIVQ